MAITQRQLIPQDHLREIFSYENGQLFWKHDPHQRKQWNKQFAGKRAGWLNAKLGYVVVCIRPNERNGLDKVRCIGAHRLIFCLHNGHYPPQVDHINGDRSDNRIENLRAALSHQNAANRSKQSTNTTGVPGVRLHKDGHYEARVQFGKKRYQVGSFKTLGAARIAIAEASRTIRGEWHREAA